jgi:hypothetical protein
MIELEGYLSAVRSDQGNGMPLIDPNKNPVGVDKRLEGETHPDRRRMLEEVRFHIAVEAALNIDGAIARLAPNPEYVLFSNLGPPVTIAGVDAIRTHFYGVLVETIDPRLEWDIVRCLVDGRTVITEGRQKSAMRGSALIKLGVDADPDALYLQHAHHLVVWPFDSELRLIGETVFFGYSTPPAEVVKRRLRPEEIGAYVGPVIEPS